MAAENIGKRAVSQVAGNPQTHLNVGFVDELQQVSLESLVAPRDEARARLSGHLRKGSAPALASGEFISAVDPRDESISFVGSAAPRDPDPRSSAQLPGREAGRAKLGVGAMEPAGAIIDPASSAVPVRAADARSETPS